MRVRTTLILVGLGLAGALFFFLVEQPRHARRIEHEAQASRLTDTNPEEVHRVSIERPDIVIEAVREDAGWRLTSPVVDRADESAINVLVLAVCRAAIERTIDAPEDALSDFGLAPPAATVGFTSSGGVLLVDLRIGDLNPSKSHCYAVERGSGEVLVLPSGVRRYALHPLFEYRDKRIINLAVSDVDRIEIASSVDSSAWTKADGTGWFTVQGGDTIAGDETAVENVLRILRGLRARDILSGISGTEDAPVVHPYGTIRLWVRGASAPISLAFGAPRHDGMYVIGSLNDRTALVDTTIVPVFAMTWENLRERRVLDFDTNALVKLVWQRGGRTLTIVQSGDSWRYTNPAFGRISPSGASRLLNGLAELRFSRILGDDLSKPSTYGFDAPLHRLTLFGAGDSEIDELVIGSPTTAGPSRYMYSRSPDMLGTIDSTSLSQLERNLAELGEP